MKIALIQPPTNCDETSLWIEPLGMCYIGAACRDAGHEVSLHDLYTTATADLGDLFARLDADPPDLVGISAMTENFRNGLEIGRAVKQRYGATVVFGGWHVSGEPQAVRDPSIDWVVRGEGEDTMLELLEHIETGSPRPEEIEGIAWFDGERVRINAPRGRLKKLDKLPLPMREGLPVERYRLPQMLSEPFSKMHTLSVQASRGCPYQCVFCQTPAVWSNRWTHRSAASVVDEIEMLLERYRMNTLFFRDEEFTVRPRWVMEICDELITRGINERLSWGAFCRVDDITPELAAKMKEAGLAYAFMGIEASNPDDADRLRKYYKREDAERAFRIFRDLDVTTQGSWIIGFPWDTQPGLEKAFSFIKTLPVDVLNIYFVAPFAGTELRRQVDEQGLLLTTDTNYFNIVDPVIRTPEIPLETLRRLPGHYLRRFYLRPQRIVQALSWVLRRPARIRIVAEALYSRYRKRRILSARPRDGARAQIMSVPAQYGAPVGKQARTPEWPALHGQGGRA